MRWSRSACLYLVLVNWTTLAYSCCTNCNSTYESFLLIQFKQNASRWKAKQNCIRSDRNTSVLYNTICIVVYLITAWFIFRAESLFSQSNQHMFSKKAKVWIEAKMPSCLNARVFAFPYLSVLWNKEILENNTEWTSPCILLLFVLNQTESEPKKIDFLFKNAHLA